jgi:hypothetical protein
MRSTIERRLRDWFSIGRISSSSVADTAHTGVAQHDDERRPEPLGGELDAADLRGRDDIAGNADDEQVAEALVEDDLRRHPRVGTAEDDGERFLTERQLMPARLASRAGRHFERPSRSDRSPLAGVRVLLALKSSANDRRKRFLVAPHVQRELSVRRVQTVHHRPGPMPSAFLIEPRGALVADRARQPPQWRHRVRTAGPRHRRSTRQRRPSHVTRPRLELIELVVFDDAQSNRGAGRTDDPDVRKGGLEPLSEALERSAPGELRRTICA